MTPQRYKADTEGATPSGGLGTPYRMKPNNNRNKRKENIMAKFTYVVHACYTDFYFENGNFAMSFAEQLVEHAQEDVVADIRVECVVDREESEDAAE